MVGSARRRRRRRRRKRSDRAASEFSWISFVYFVSIGDTILYCFWSWISVLDIIIIHCIREHQSVLR